MIADAVLRGVEENHTLYNMAHELDFDAIDSNRDGVISRAELADYNAKSKSAQAGAAASPILGGMAWEVRPQLAPIRQISLIFIFQCLA